MPRMPKKRKLELSFFLNERGRVRLCAPAMTQIFFPLT